jgi:hypothetical protein
MNETTINNILKWIENDTFDFSSEIFQSQNNTLFYKRLILQPFARIKDNTIYIKINFENRSAILKFVKHIKTDKKIYFVKFLFPEKEKIDEFSIAYEDLLTMVENYSDKKYFYGFRKNNFNFKKCISDYITKYSASEIFNQVYDDDIYVDPDLDRRSSNVLGKEYDDSVFWHLQELKFRIDDINIRTEIYNINRELKINSVLDFLDDNIE